MSSGLFYVILKQMDQKDISQDKFIELDLSFISSFFSNYKLPLLFSFIGLILIYFGFSYQSKKQNSPPQDIKIIKGQQSDVICVHIAGAVIAPGVYDLPPSSRLKDALIAAGGLSKDANRDYIEKNINLAQTLKDETKVYIPFISESPSNITSDNTLGVSDSASSKINFNTATLTELDSLSGVGPVTAQKIIDNRPYNSLQDLIDKKVLWQSTLDKIKDKITI